MRRLLIFVGLINRLGVIEGGPLHLVGFAGDRACVGALLIIAFHDGDTVWTAVEEGRGEGLFDALEVLAEFLVASANDLAVGNGVTNAGLALGLREAKCRFLGWQKLLRFHSEGRGSRIDGGSS